MTTREYAQLTLSCLHTMPKLKFQSLYIVPPPPKKRAKILKFSE